MKMSLQPYINSLPLHVKRTILLDSRIRTFIKKHHLLSLATSANNQPYCASCFYAFIENEPILIIATDTQKTRHGKEALANETVAGVIALETNIIGKIQGVQFTGIFKEATAEEKRVYLKRFPYALALNPTLWSIHITYLKFTDNTLGFGKKLEFFAPNVSPNSFTCNA
ncbi:pyridoxamine 5'-phosphate oxidase family protein [Sulfurospirillum deleyianum]|uniref:pyridoxamine 5'-phosphate oxidase family protein n=1 Tax=Sulfurospirillum deleyianum TaxID=65553 RepID=UPI0001A3192F|nr:pyridoxamine 5'-phosphate oxidase family protein [Sulfurospirillum deleyianum]